MQDKCVIDKIDRVLARHYGFTDEELDFIINYDIKYQMGKARRGRGIILNNVITTMNIPICASVEGCGILSQEVGG